MQSKCKHSCKKCTSSSVRHSKGEVVFACLVSLVGWLSSKGSSSNSLVGPTINLWSSMFMVGNYLSTLGITT